MCEHLCLQSIVFLSQDLSPLMGNSNFTVKNSGEFGKHRQQKDHQRGRSHDILRRRITIYQHPDRRRTTSHVTETQQRPELTRPYNAHSHPSHRPPEFRPEIHLLQVQWSTLRTTRRSNDGEPRFCRYCRPIPGNV